jgi:hypothetical protein
LLRKNIQGNSVEDLIARLVELSGHWRADWSPLLSFSTRTAIAEYGIQMPRCPMPRIGFRFDNEFTTTLLEAHQVNSAIHDGITALVREPGQSEYVVHGWSYWFLPNVCQIANLSDENKGTAHHTCAVLSKSGHFDLLCRLTNKSVEVFADGELRIYNGGKSYG